ncbi:MAG: hypothetical protein QOE23_3106, partial [Pseudonocardiales bacterium]|nr:hypothetical protein [Pseudonocardiales bacterium]
PPGFARAVNVPILAARFGTGLDPDRLAGAFEAVQARHEALRLRLITGEDGPRQLIEPAAGRVERVSLPGSPSDPQLAEEFQRVLVEPRDLAVDGPAVARLYEFDGGYAALLAVTHVAADGWSVGVLNRDLAALYSRAPLPELPLDYYRNYVQGQHELGPFLTGRQTEFFAGSLTGVPVLPLRRALPAEPATAYRALRRPLPFDVAGSVYELAGRLRTTPAKLLMAATFLACKDYFGADTFAVLDVSAARGREQLDWAGLLSKGVPVPVPSSDGLTTGEFVARVHRHSLRALSMLAGPYSLKRVLALLQASGDSPAATELYRRHWTDQAPAGHAVMFNCLTIAPPALDPFGPGVEYRPLYPAEPLAAEKNRISDLDVLPLIDGTSISLGITAHPAVHDEADVERVLATLEAILTGWARGWDPDRPLG